MYSGTVGHTKGQVIGGRWKPLHYMMARHLYANVMATCGSWAAHGAGNVCYVTNDGIDAFVGSVEVSAVPLGSNATAPAPPPHVVQVTLGPGPGVRSWFHLPRDFWALGAAGTHVYTSRVLDAATNTTASNHVILPAPPKDLAIQPAAVTFKVGAAGPDGCVPITVAADALALYVTFTTLAQGRFSDNAILVEAGEPRTLSFIPFAGFDHAELTATLRVEHLADNL